MNNGRRQFIGGAGAVMVALSWGERARAAEARNPVFVHGVASGDPLADRVILWTRVSPVRPVSVPVRWEVSRSPDFRHAVAQGVVVTRAAQDYTVKVDATGLLPDRTYYYRFHALGMTSAIGRTRTLPLNGVDRLRLAVASCSNYPFGFFNSYGAIARRTELNAVLHLGDYLYEYANGTYGDGSAIGRIPSPDREILSLADYRQRHAQYKTDADLQEAHRQHPFICIWDDHESANDAWKDGAENHQPDEGVWSDRKAAAIQAYLEWMPIRVREPRIYRQFRFGGLADLIMLDTRLYARDQQAASGSDFATIADPDRTLLGDEQEAWLFDALQQSRARNATWRLIGQQVMMSQLVAGPTTIFNPDQWDGYLTARNRVYANLAEQGIGNVVVLTGDIHSSWANELTPNPFDPSTYNPATGAGALAVEFVTPGITSPGIPDAAQAAALGAQISATHPHVKYVDLFRRGYMLLDVTAAEMHAEWYHPDTILAPSQTEHFGAAFRVESGQAHLLAVASPLPAPAGPPAAP